MAGFSTLAELLTEITTNGKSRNLPFNKSSSTAEAAGVMHSLWTAAGLPGIGANPAGTPGIAYDDTVGGFVLQDEASDFKFLMALDCMASSTATLIVYDRLVGVGAVDLTTTGDKTIASAALPRYTGADAAGNEVWLEVTTATTVTAPIVSINSYTDEGGNTGAVGDLVTFPAVATNVGAIIPLPLAPGDYGVRAVATLNVNTAASAGACNLLIVRRLATIPLMANIGAMVDFVRGYPSFPRIYDGATLALAFVSTTASATAFQGSLLVGWG